MSAPVTPGPGHGTPDGPRACRPSGVKRRRPRRPRRPADGPTRAATAARRGSPDARPARPAPRRARAVRADGHGAAGDRAGRDAVAVDGGRRRLLPAPGRPRRARDLGERSERLHREVAALQSRRRRWRSGRGELGMVPARTWRGSSCAGRAVEVVGEPRAAVAPPRPPHRPGSAATRRPRRRRRRPPESTPRAESRRPSPTPVGGGRRGRPSGRPGPADRPPPTGRLGTDRTPSPTRPAERTAADDTEAARPDRTRSGEQRHTDLRHDRHRPTRPSDTATPLVRLERRPTSRTEHRPPSARPRRDRLMPAAPPRTRPAGAARRAAPRRARAAGRPAPAARRPRCVAARRPIVLVVALALATLKLVVVQGPQAGTLQPRSLPPAHHRDRAARRARRDPRPRRRAAGVQRRRPRAGHQPAADRDHARGGGPRRLPQRDGRRGRQATGRTQRRPRGHAHQRQAATSCSPSSSTRRSRAACASGSRRSPRRSASRGSTRAGRWPPTSSAPRPGTPRDQQAHRPDGLESSQDNLLAGPDGVRVVDTAEGSYAVIPGSTRFERPATPGSDLQLTLDSDLQYTVQRQLAEYAGAKGGQGRPRPWSSTPAPARSSRWPTRGRSTPATSPAATSDTRQRRGVQPVRARLGEQGRHDGRGAGVRDTAPGPGVHRARQHPGRRPHGQRRLEPRHRALHADRGPREVVERRHDHDRARGREDRFADMLARFGLGQRTGVGLPGESAGRVPPARPGRARRSATCPSGRACR